MKVLIATLCAGFAALAATAANAAPASHSGHLGTLLTDHRPVVAVRDDDGKRKFDDHDRHDRRHYDRRHDRHHYDRRHGKYRGWHRYNKRPHGWRERGCVVVGPIWFCP